MIYILWCMYTKTYRLYLDLIIMTNLIESCISITVTPKTRLILSIGMIVILDSIRKY